MILTDINQSWKRPEGYHVYSVRAEGGYLRVEFNKLRDPEEDISTRQTLYITDTITIFVNDAGREVMRTAESSVKTKRWVDDDTIPVERRQEVGRWFRFKNALLLMFEGFVQAVKSIWE